jgi:hypothetical protein
MPGPGMVAGQRAAALTYECAFSRIDAIEVRVERATGPFCRATSPTVERTAR